ncbi:hypothetical protein HAX54_041747 [Datura stramonium]|uniref:Uncharacterized protein n=1 Tax=Datura stramonium TaxID=4076 RepID=A0ABS8SLM4_DATST|nr:hypothetical protein [Datura stramonium]
MAKGQGRALAKTQGQLRGRGRPRKIPLVTFGSYVGTRVNLETTPVRVEPAVPSDLIAPPAMEMTTSTLGHPGVSQKLVLSPKTPIDDISQNLTNRTVQPLNAKKTIEHMQAESVPKLNDEEQEPAIQPQKVLIRRRHNKQVIQEWRTKGVVAPVVKEVSKLQDAQPDIQSNVCETMPSSSSPALISPKNSQVQSLGSPEFNLTNFPLLAPIPTKKFFGDIVEEFYC